MTTRILIVDGQDLFRAAISAWLRANRAAQVDVVADAPDIEAAVPLVARHLPDVMLVTGASAGAGLAGLVARATDLQPELGVLVLIPHDDDQAMVKAMQAGARACLLDSTSPQTLVAAIKAVADGHTYFGADLLQHVSDALGRSSARERRLARLTPRHLDVLRLLVEGLSTHDIAERLGVSSKTIDSHRAVLMRRLGVRTVAALVRLTLSEGLLTKP